MACRDGVVAVQTAMLLKAGMKRQLPTIAGVFALVAAASLALALAVSLYLNANGYAAEQMDRLGYGDTTVWVSGTDDLDGLAADVSALPEVGEVRAQPLVFSSYRVNDYRSDDEGQIIAYDAQAYPYAFMDEGMTGHATVDSVEPGSVYVSPALLESAGAQAGDVVSFGLARTGEPYELVIAGAFEDPFMGSSMIDMKSFLVSPEDYAAVEGALASASAVDVLGRAGGMLHVRQADGGALSALDFDRALAASGGLSGAAEFSYSRDAVLDMALLQVNVLAGFLALFAGALVLATLIVLAHAVASSIEQERRDIAALKTVGCASGTLRFVQLAQYAAGALAGMVAGTALAAVASGGAASLLVSSSGLLAPGGLRMGWCLPAYAAVLLALAAVVAVKTRAITSVPPVEAAGGEARRTACAVRTPLDSRALALSLAVRRIASDAGRYAATFAIAALLAFFVSAVGRVNAWVGPNGEGLMDAFSAAGHDLGVQPLNPTDMEGVERLIAANDSIVGVYSLAMQPVRADGAAYTANVIDAPERFHILEGRTCASPDEVVLTRTVAADLGLGVGDTVSVAAEGPAQEFRVAGIYQCANEMGANMGMSLEGYARIGDVRGYIWCYHYLLADGTRNEQVAAELQDAYGASAAVHTNSWSGLSGLVGTMRALLVLLYGMSALLVLVSMALASGKLLLAERVDLAVFKGIGFTSRQLRASFALRMGVVVALGAAAGLALSAAFADAAVSQLMRLFGIGAFSSPFGLADSIAPAAGITVLAMGFAYLFSRRIKRARPVELFADFDE